MLAGTHALTGAAIWETAKDMKPKWVRWPLALSAAFFSHWILDSLCVYHDLTKGVWWDRQVVTMTVQMV
jgi:hypothetical protein